MVNESYLPRQGNEDDFIERLKEYIRNFDSEWEKNVCGATEEELSKIRELSWLEEYNKNFPKIYLEYLVNFGKDDGGLCFSDCKEFNGVEDIIDLYEDLHSKGLYDDIIYPFIHFFTNIFLEREYNIYLEDKKLPVVASSYENMERIYYESLEKFIFYNAFLKFECNKEHTVIYYKFTETLKLSDSKIKFLEMLDKVALKQGWQKMWFSDDERKIIYREKNGLQIIINTEIHKTNIIIYYEPVRKEYLDDVVKIFEKILDEFETVVKIIL